MILSVKTPEDVARVDPNTEVVHLVRPLGLEKVRELLAKVDKVTMSQSTFERLSRRAQSEAKKVAELEVGKVRAGRPLKVSPDAIREIVSLKREGLSVRQIAQELELSKSSVHYLLKYAVREKVSFEGKTLHLKGAEAPSENAGEAFD